MCRLIKIRPVLSAALALAVTTQPLAGNLCHCNEHGDAGSMAGAHSSAYEYGERHGDVMVGHTGMKPERSGMMADHGSTAPDHAGADGYESPDGACQCDACSQSFGLLVQTGDAFRSLPAQGAIAPPHYLEPPQRRALRPPIPA